jgi:hypothetical protein
MSAAMEIRAILMDAINDIATSNSLADLAVQIRIEHEDARAAVKRGIEHAMAAGDLLIGGSSISYNRPQAAASAADESIGLSEHQAGEWQPAAE